MWTDVLREIGVLGGMPNMTDATGALGRPGTRYTVWFGRVSSRCEVLELDFPGLIRTRLEGSLLRGETTVTFEPEAGGTRMTQVFRIEGLLPRICARILGTGSCRGSFQGELKEFARRVERERLSHLIY